MTKQELIEALKSYPDDIEIIIDEDHSKDPGHLMLYYDDDIDAMKQQETPEPFLRLVNHSIVRG